MRAETKKKEDLIEVYLALKNKRTLKSGIEAIIPRGHPRALSYDCFFFHATMKNPHEQGHGRFVERGSHRVIPRACRGSNAQYELIKSDTWITGGIDRVLAYLMC